MFADWFLSLTAIGGVWGLGRFCYPEIQLPERPQIVPLFSSKHAIVWERGGAEFNGSMGAALVWLNVAPPEERLDVSSTVADVPLHAAAARFCV